MGPGLSQKEVRPLRKEDVQFGGPKVANGRSWIAQAESRGRGACKGVRKGEGLERYCCETAIRKERNSDKRRKIEVSIPELRRKEASGRSQNKKDSRLLGAKGESVGKVRGGGEKVRRGLERMPTGVDERRTKPANNKGA